MKLAIIAFALLGAVLASPIQQMPRADTQAERQMQDPVGFWMDYDDRADAPAERQMMDFRPDRDPSPSSWFDDYIDRADTPAERQIKSANGE